MNQPWILSVFISWDKESKVFLIYVYFIDTNQGGALAQAKQKDIVLPRKENEKAKQP